jgi:hypothetical protein
METIKIKVEQDYIGWYAYDSSKGLDFEVSGEDWRNCGSRIGTGKRIADAIEDLMEQLNEDRAGKADPNDNSFVYDQPFNWN